MENSSHPDPLTEAASRAGERMVQTVSLLAAGGQKFLQLAAYLRESRLRRIAAERYRARLAWAPAHDPDWLAAAGLHEVARVWGAAMPYAQPGVRWYDRTAESAMANCEARLRELHPYAMARYDRLRGDGLPAEAAMRETAPLFAAPPTVHPAGPAGRPAELTAAAAGTIPERGATFDRFEHGPSKEEFLAIRRGRAIAAGRDGDGDARTYLEASTNLAPEAIGHAVAGVPDGSRAADVALARALRQRLIAAERARCADLDGAVDDPATPADERTDRLGDARRQAAYADGLKTRSPVRLAARDFPFTIEQVREATRQPSTQSNTRANIRVNDAAIRRRRR